MKRFETVAMIACMLTAHVVFGDDGVASWSGPAPEDLSPVTVRYADVARNMVIVEGERYRVTTQLRPVAITAIEVNGTNLLSEPMIPGFVDSKGVRYVPQQKGIPTWQTWQGQSYKPARSAAARVNVWNAGPYYWDAHVLDIPLVPEAMANLESTHEGETVQTWNFEKDAEGWGEEANDCKRIDVKDGQLTIHYEGDDPWVVSPVIDKRGPFLIKLRLRSTQAGQGQLYYATKAKGFHPSARISFDIEEGAAWQDISIPITINPTFMRFRIDPPGNTGSMAIDRIELKRLDLTVPDNNSVVRGELVFHTFADRLNIEFRVAPEKTGVIPVSARWNLEAGSRQTTTIQDRAIMQWDGVALLAPPAQTYEDGHLDVPLTPLAASPDVLRCWWVLRPTSVATDMHALFLDELSPLPDDSFTVKNGRYLGYDAAAGLYTLDAITPGFGFNAAYDNPNRRIEIPVTIRSNGRQRRILVKSISHVGMLPATVLADQHGFMLPTPVLSCKNFSGEREEPDDSGFGHAFFPIELAPEETKSFQILHLFQNWGDHMLKQVSSIRFFHIYWHLSTGVSETTCFTIPSMKLNDVWVRIPDYRPYSGAFWKGQPQHDCLSWPGFLQYQSDGGEVRLLYEKTVFESIAPNLALFTMHFASSDGAARATARVLEIPQGDEARTFLKIRYDFDKDVSIRGDARETFRWLNVNDKERPRDLVYLDADGKSVAEPIRAGAHQVLGQELGAAFPFVGTHGIPGTQGTTYYSSLALVRGFKARLGGKDQDRVFFSAHYGVRNGNYWLTAPDKELVIKAGDFIEADIMLMPHAEGTEPLVVPERERLYYGTEGPRVAVETGRLIETFPATVAADNEVVALTVEGGTEATPIIAKGFDHWATPLLWVNGQWQNQQAHGGDGYQVNPDGDGNYRFTFLVKQRQGHPRNVMVTRAACSTGISRMTDRSGYLELSTDADEGTFSVRAPMLPGKEEDNTRPRTAAIFAPGVNAITAGEPATAFVGTAKRVRQIPLNVEPVSKTVTVTVTQYDERQMSLTVSGAAKLEFDALAGGIAYRLTIDGREEIMRTPVNGRQLTVTVGEGVHKVSLEYGPQKQ